MFDRGSEGWIEFLGELGKLGRRAFLEAKGGAAAAAAHEEL
jgi:hypothetical protein